MKRLSHSSLFFLALLVSCIPATCNCDEGLAPAGVRPNDTQLDPKTLISATTGQPLIVEEQGNCLLDPVKIPGEGSRVAGSAGGLFIDPNPVGIVPGNALNLGQTIYEVAAPKASEIAVLIVVDDFNGGSDGGRSDQESVYFIDTRPGNTLAGLGSGATEADVAQLEGIGQYSHGALVFNHTLALFHSLQSEFAIRTETVEPLPVANLRSSIFAPPAQADTAFAVTVAYLDSLALRVVALDTEGFNTEVIGQRLEATIEHFARQEIRRFAVNLSFGLVPCSILNDFDISNSPTFEEYLEEVASGNGVNAEQFRNELRAILTTPVGDESIENLASARLNEGAEIVYLAAAGNYRFPFSLFPGYWSEFVSVSAKNLASADEVKDPDYSNTGEVLLDGGYFRLSAYDPTSNAWRDYPNISVAGTSFAAPVLSVFTALDLTNARPRCARNSGEITTPLAFFKTDPPVLTPGPALDLPLARALSDYCMLE